MTVTEMRTKTKGEPIERKVKPRRLQEKVEATARWLHDGFPVIQFHSNRAFVHDANGFHVQLFVLAWPQGAGLWYSRPEIHLFSRFIRLPQPDSIGSFQTKAKGPCYHVEGANTMCVAGSREENNVPRGSSSTSNIYLPNQTNDQILKNLSTMQWSPVARSCWLTSQSNYCNLLVCLSRFFRRSIFPALQFWFKRSPCTQSKEASTSPAVDVQKTYHLVL